MLRPLFGRTVEIETAADVLAHVRAGGFRTLLIEGEAGVGKTRLVQAVVARARDDGFHVYADAAPEFDHHRPFGVLAAALGCGADAADRDRAHVAALLNTAATGPGSTGDGNLAVLVGDAIGGVVEADAISTPVLLAIDDLQWADPATVVCVGALARRLAHLPVALALSYRPPPHPDVVERLLVTLTAGGATLLTVPPLDAVAVDELAALVAGGPPGEGLRHQVSGAGGNPLFVIELIDALRAEGALDVTDGHVDVSHRSLPPSMRRTILRRVSLLSSDAVQLLRLASVLGSRFSVVDLAALADRSSTSLLGPLQEALQAGIFGEAADQLAFRHDLVREAIYADLPLAIRAAMHRDAARLLAARDAPPYVVATQYALGATKGDHDAVEWLHRAALRIGSGAPATRVELLRRANELAGNEDPLRDVVGLDLLWGLAAIGATSECESTALEMLARPLDAITAGRARAALGLVLQRSGRLGESREEFRVAAELPEIPDAHRADYLADASAAGLLLGDIEGARREARAAVQLGEAVANAGAVCEALDTLCWAALAEGAVADAVGFGERAVALRNTGAGALGGHPVPHLYLGVALIDADRLPEAVQTLATGMKLAEEEGTVAQIPWYHSWRSVAAYLAGTWEHARAEAQAAIALAEEVGALLGLRSAYSVLALIDVQGGDVGSARTLLEAASGSPPVDDGGLSDGWQGSAEAAMHALEGSLPDALVSLERAWTMTETLPFLVVRRAIGPELVRLALLAGRPELAEHVAAVQAEGARAADGIPTAAGAALCARGLVARDPELLLAAVDSYRAGPRPHGLARACEHAASVLDGEEHAARAISLLEEAADVYESLGAHAASARVAAALRARGVRRSRRPTRGVARTGWESLTPTERDVVRLTMEGLTNPQIGNRMFISRRTVQTHLSHVFAKLGISTRAELAAKAAQAGLG